MALCLRNKRDEFEELFRLTTESLLVLKQKVAESGAGLVLMLIPDEYQVNPEVTQAVLKATGRSIKDYDLDLPQRRLSEFLKANEISYLNLLPAFLERGQEQPLYKLYDTH